MFKDFPAVNSDNNVCLKRKKETLRTLWTPTETLEIFKESMCFSVAVTFIQYIIV